MRSLIRAWKSLPSEHKDYLFIHTAGLLWALAFFFFTPPSIDEVVTYRLIVGLWLLSCVIGSILALVGIFTRDNLILERLGVTLVMVTPLIYSMLQFAAMIYYIFQPVVDGATPWYARLGAIVLGLWLFLFYNKRRRQLKFRVIEARATPLADEKDQQS